MATAQASTPASAPGPDAAAAAASSSSAGAPSAGSAAGSDGAANSAASSVKDATASGSKAASASPMKITVPHRDKESLNKVQIDRFITRDWVHSAALHDSQELMRKLYHDQVQKSKEYHAVRREYKLWFPPSKLFGEGYQGYGNGYTETGGPSRIVYPPFIP